MVDFNDTNTVGTPAADIVRVLVLEARKYAYDAWEDYYKKKLQKVSFPLATVRARLFTLFMNIRPALIRRWKADSDKFKELDKCVRSGEADEIIEAFYIIDNYLDETKLTRLDTRQSYDKTDIEKDNASRD